ncbi:DUF4326 domain-containing protein [Streptomyces sp. SID8352]|uniref:DUF4326 domain-containing protein n=1 Tax=Streptomyces sp. SID8352 TaxID=2690338 RepID=UPI001926FF92|nr:DUF4326 domain-containing protein [Streptomyces sp. SID8352]
MTPPRRIQRRRTKGWRAPHGAVYVGRGTRWGNPNRIVPADFGGWDVTHDHGSTVGTFASKHDARLFAVESYRAHLEDHADLAVRARRDLAGRDLMCWCPLDEPCHADVLLELANPADDCLTCEHFLPASPPEEQCNPDGCGCTGYPDACDIHAAPAGATFPIANCPRWQTARTP